MTYIYNHNRDLRTSLERVHYTQISHPEFGPMYLAVVDCEDKCVGGWDHIRTYCGLMMIRDDETEIRQIMHNGASVNSLQHWLNKTS